MATRKDLLRHLWNNVINVHLSEEALDHVVENCKRDPMAPFADTGAAISRLLAAGVSRRDICILRRDAAYEAVFATLYALDDPGVDDDDVFMLHESLLMADPSGREGRPGSGGAV